MSLKSRELYMQKHKCNREQDIVFGGHRDFSCDWRRVNLGACEWVDDERRFVNEL